MNFPLLCLQSCVDVLLLLLFGSLPRPSLYGEIEQMAHKSFRNFFRHWMKEKLSGFQFSKTSNVHFTSIQFCD